MIWCAILCPLTVLCVISSNVGRLGVPAGGPVFPLLCSHVQSGFRDGGLFTAQSISQAQRHSVISSNFALCAWCKLGHWHFAFVQNLFSTLLPNTIVLLCVLLACRLYFLSRWATVFDFDTTISRTDIIGPWTRAWEGGCIKWFQHTERYGKFFKR